MFSVLTGAIIWVRFEKQTPMIEGEEDRPAAGSRRPRRGRFCHLRPPGCGVPAGPATISSTTASRFAAALGLSVQSVQSVDCIRLPLGTSGGTPLAGMAAVFIAGRKI